MHQRLGLCSVPDICHSECAWNFLPDTGERKYYDQKLRSIGNMLKKPGGAPPNQNLRVKNLH
jgi:hypothetical protein